MYAFSPKTRERRQACILLLLVTKKVRRAGRHCGGRACSEVASAGRSRKPFKFEYIPCPVLVLLIEEQVVTDQSEQQSWRSTDESLNQSPCPCSIINKTDPSTFLTSFPGRLPGWSFLLKDGDSGRIVPLDRPSLILSTKQRQGLHLPGLGHHVDGLDGDELEPALSEHGQIAGEGLGITGEVGHGTRR